MTISKKYNICGSRNLQTLLYGDFSINKCNVCGFQYIPNNEKYIGDVYANMERYYNQIKRIVLGSSEESTPFWGAIMRVVINGGKK